LGEFGGIELLQGVEEAASFAAESIGGSLAGPGIGLGLFIIQTLWTNAQNARTDRLRQEGYEKHFFEPHPEVPVGDSLMYGQLGYACKFFEFDPESETHHAWEWGDPFTWLPIFVLDQYDVFLQVRVTRVDGTTHDAVG